MAKIEQVKMAMLAVQRYPWEQGVCMQALYELGDYTTAYAMAHDAVLRQTADGRFAVTGDNIAVTDPAACGEVVFRAYEATGNDFYKNAADRMLSFLMNAAPRTDEDILWHNEISFWPEYSPAQIWVDSIYMAPPFLAVMGETEEAYKQIVGMMKYLQDEKTGLLYHIFDAGNNEYVRKKLWATGNGWALLGIARVAKSAREQGKIEIAEKLEQLGKELLDNMLKYQLGDGRFHDFLDDESSFVEGAAAMMMAAAIYRGIEGKWLPMEYKIYADKVADTMDAYVDDLGIIRQVCGCPDFVSEGTSAESMAAYLMMHGWKMRLEK